MRLPVPIRRPRLRWSLSLAALALAACGPLERRPIRPPFLPPIHYGEVVQEIRLEGVSVTDPDLVRNTLESRVGEIYTEDDAATDYFRLLQMEIFTSVYFTTERLEDGIALTVHVAELGRYRPTLSLDNVPENGWEAGPAFGSPNFLGRGHKASTWFRYGRSRSAGFYLKDTWHAASNWYDCCWDVRYDWRDRWNYLDDFDERSHEVVVEYLASLSETFRLGPRVSYLSVFAGPDSLGAVPASILDPDGKDEIPGLGLAAVYDSRNLTTYPTRGWYLEGVVEAFGGSLGGPANYTRLTLDGRRYFELSGAAHSLALYSLASYTPGVMGRDIPLHQDFNLGGSNTIRGWSNESREGRSQWINTAEYWWNLVPRSDFRLWFLRWSVGLQLAAFVDVGTVWDDQREFHDHWIGGGGVGVRLTLPNTGLLRMDFGIGETSPSLSLGVHFGTGEKADSQRRRIR